MDERFDAIKVFFQLYEFCVETGSEMSIPKNRTRTKYEIKKINKNKWNWFNDYEIEHKT